jgi:hypothetical protein
MFEGVKGFDLYRDRLSAITKSANELLFDLVEEMSFAHEAGRPDKCDREQLDFECHELTNKLLTTRNEFVYANQSTMLKVLGVEEVETA